MKLSNLLIALSICIATNTYAQDLNIHVNNKGKVGFVDKTGAIVVKCAYDSAQPFEDGVAIVSKSDKYGLIDSTGKVILPLAYSGISDWTKDIYLVKDGKKMGLVDHKGNFLLKPVYSLITRPNCYGKALIAQGGKASPIIGTKQTYMFNAKYGIINAEGRILIDALHKGLYEFTYDGKQSTIFSEGKRLEFSYHATSDTLKTDCEYVGFSTYGSEIYNCGVMDGNGKQLVAPKLYLYVMKPESGMVRYYNFKKKQYLCGYHNIETGKSFQATSFETTKDGNLDVWTHGDFHGDMAPVNKGDSWCFVDKDGNVKRSGYSKFSHSPSLAMWAAQKKDGGCDVFDEKNNDISTLSAYQYVSFPQIATDKERFLVKKDGKYGCVTRTGEVTVPFEYDGACASKYDVFAVMKDKKWGMVSVDNKKLIPTDYANIILPQEVGAKDFWVMKSDSLYYHYNTDRQKLSGRGYKSVCNFIDGIAHVAPVDMKLDDDQVTRSQLFGPNTSQTTIAAQDLEKCKGAYGILLTKNDEVLIDKPVSTLYVDAVKKEIKKLGNKKPTKTEIKKILLKVTMENRTYDLKSTLDEDEWDY